MENNTQNTSAESNAIEMVKPKRGRPRKNPIQAEPLVKRKRGRPRKNVEPAANQNSNQTI